MAAEPPVPPVLLLVRHRGHVSPQQVELCWIGEVLVHAVEAVNAKCFSSSRSTGGAETESGEAATPTNCGGVFDLCRSLFRHCVTCIEDPEGRRAGAEVDTKVIWYFIFYSCQCDEMCPCSAVLPVSCVSWIRKDGLSVSTNRLTDGLITLSRGTRR